MDKVLRKKVSNELRTFIHKHTDRVGGSTVEDIGQYIGLKRKALDHRMQGNTALTVEEVQKLSAVLEDNSLIQGICSIWGGVFTPAKHNMGDEMPEQTREDALNCLAIATKETGEALAEVMETLRDSIATPEEKERVRQEVQEMVTAAQDLLSSVESMPEKAPARIGYLRDAK